MRGEKYWLPLFKWGIILDANFCSPLLKIFSFPDLLFTSPIWKKGNFFSSFVKKKIFSCNISWLSNFQVVKKSWSGSRVQQLQDKNFEWYCQENPRLQRILFMQLRCPQMWRARGKIANPSVWPKIKDHTLKCLPPSRIHYLTPLLYPNYERCNLTILAPLNFQKVKCETVVDSLFF